MNFLRAQKLIIGGYSGGGVKDKILVTGSSGFIGMHLVESLF